MHTMWTRMSRVDHNRDRLRYASDTTDAEWAVLEPLLPPAASRGRPPKWPLRELVDAIFYVLRGACSGGCCRTASRRGRWCMAGSQPGAMAGFGRR